MSSVPTVDISGALAGDPGGMEAAARAVDDACVASGFFVVMGHGVRSGLVDETMAMARQFFRLPFGEKQKVAPPNFEDYRGFLGLDTTSLAATLGDDETPPDLCESFNVGRFDDPELRDRAFVAGGEATFCPNRWPDEPAGLRPLFERYYAVMERLCMQMLPIFARALDLPPAWFDDKVRDHTALLLFNWYPPVAGAARPGQMRRGAHTDYGAFTVVAAEQIPGLQIRSNGDWADVPMVPGGFVGEPRRLDGPLDQRPVGLDVASGGHSRGRRPGPGPDVGAVLLPADLPGRHRDHPDHGHRGAPRPLRAGRLRRVDRGQVSVHARGRRGNLAVDPLGLWGARSLDSAAAGGGGHGRGRSRHGGARHRCPVRPRPVRSGRARGAWR